MTVVTASSRSNCARSGPGRIDDCVATTRAAPTLSGMTISKIDASKLGEENGGRSSGASPNTSRWASTRFESPRWQSDPLGLSRGARREDDVAGVIRARIARVLVALRGDLGPVGIDPDRLRIVAGQPVGHVAAGQDDGGAARPRSWQRRRPG